MLFPCLGICLGKSRMRRLMLQELQRFFAADGVHGLTRRIARDSRPS